MVIIREAEPGDNDALVDLMSRCPQGTNLVVRLDRAPDFFSRSQPYDDFRTFVAEDTGKIVGTVECALKRIMRNGQEQLAGYAYSLAVDSAYRGQRLAQSLEEACTTYATEAGADLMFCWILEDNTPSLKASYRMGFREERNLKVYAMLPYRLRKLPEGIRSMQDHDREQVVEILNKTYADHDYYYPYNPETLSAFLERLPGFNQEDYYVYEKDGEILSCLGCWDYSQAINGTIIQLSRQLRMVSAAFRFLRIFGRVPRVPEMGKNWAYCVPELGGYRHNPGDLLPLWYQLNNFAVDRKANVVLFPLDPRSDLVKIARQGLNVSVGLHQLVKPLKGQDLPVSERLIYADPIDI